MARKTGSRNNSASKPLPQRPRHQPTVTRGPIPPTFLGGLPADQVLEARRWSERATAGGEFGKSYIVDDEGGTTATGLWDPIFD